MRRIQDIYYSTQPSYYSSNQTSSFRGYSVVVQRRRVYPNINSLKLIYLLDLFFQIYQQSTLYKRDLNNLFLFSQVKGLEIQQSFLLGKAIIKGIKVITFFLVKVLELIIILKPYKYRVLYQILNLFLDIKLYIDQSYFNIIVQEVFISIIFYKLNSLLSFL